MNNRMLILVSLLTLSLGWGAVLDADDPSSLSMVVMDPLAAPLSCPCVEGYAQRDYQVLAKHLGKSLGCNVNVFFAESLPVALEKNGGRADIVIGKHSVVLADLKTAEVKATPVARLTDKKGLTTQYGMIVVNKDDPAAKVEDLAGYTIIFGPAEAEEKSSAALTLLSKAGVNVPIKRRKVDAACSDGACTVIDLGPKSKTAAVISSYAQPLLEGCGTIKKGDLRVVAKTAPVPFVTVFLNAQLEDGQRKDIAKSLEKVADAPTTLEALESLVGFVPVSTKVVAKKN